jgi:flagellar FliL protein
MPPSPPSTKKPEEEAAAPKVAGSATGGGLKPWLPLLANLVLMPVMAYLTIALVLVPKMQGVSSSHGEGGKSKSQAHGGSAESSKEGAKTKVKASLKDKVMVNLAGSQGTRYLVAKITLVGSSESLKKLVEDNEEELRSAAGDVLRAKTISDLEKPGAQTVLRAELISVFSNILGSGQVDEILLTDFAIQ